MPDLEIHDPKLYALTLATAIDEFRRRLENLAGYATCPEVEPLSPGFARAEADGLDQAWSRILGLRDHGLAMIELRGTFWTRDSLRYVVDSARDRASRVITVISGDKEGRTLGVWGPDDLNSLAFVVGAAALLKDLAKQLEAKSE